MATLREMKGLESAVELICLMREIQRGYAEKEATLDLLMNDMGFNEGEANNIYLRAKSQATAIWANGSTKT